MVWQNSGFKLSGDDKLWFSHCKSWSQVAHVVTCFFSNKCDSPVLIGIPTDFLPRSTKPLTRKRCQLLLHMAHLTCLRSLWAKLLKVPGSFGNLGEPPRRWGDRFRYLWLNHHLFQQILTMSTCTRTIENQERPRLFADGLARAYKTNHPNRNH